MTTVKQIIQTKGPDVWTVSPDACVRDVLQMLIERKIGALPVVDGGKLVGIISERDYIRKVALSDKLSLNTEVGKIMTTQVCYVEPTQTVEDCMALMTDKRVRHLPVLDGEKLVGIVSIGDLVKNIISHQEFMIKQLEHYISGVV
ncbi:MAG: CBS domain-containing protein [Chloroflexi bacterium]|nr:MAG: CBS domain-containing protein [Chloroflexota bacterium]